jgi:hypothetical protein
LSWGVRMPSAVKVARSPGRQVAGGGLVGDLCALEISSPAHAVAENGIEHRIDHALGKIMRGNELVEFDPGRVGISDTTCHRLGLHVMRAQVERQPEVGIVARLPGAVAGMSQHGVVVLGEGLSFPALDLFVHAWDVGKSAALDMALPAEAVEFARSVLVPIPAGRTQSRVFAAENPAPSGATDSRAFIAWTGRDPDWQPKA